jgi:hypothetical protein
LDRVKLPGGIYGMAAVRYRRFVLHFKCPPNIPWSVRTTILLNAPNMRLTKLGGG